MSIDFHARLESLHDFLWAEYRISDHQAIDILVSSLLPIGLPCPRIILETGWPAFDCTPAWFSMAGAHAAFSLPQMRASRPRNTIDLLRAWRTENEKPNRPLLLVDSTFEVPATYHWILVREYDALVRSCVHLRTAHPKSAANLILIPARSSSKEEKFKSLLKDVLDCRFREPFPLQPPALPKDFLYWCELAFKLGGKYRPTWETLINHAAWVVIRQAYMLDRPVQAIDWALAGRLLADQIPWWTMRTIQCIEESENQFATKERVANYTNRRFNSVKNVNNTAVMEGALIHGKRRTGSTHPYGWKVADQNIFKLARGAAFSI